MSFRAARPTSTTMVLLLICGAALPAQGKGQTFVVRADGKNIVRFTSRDLLETIDGRTGQTKGSFRVNPKRLSAGLKGTIEVDLTSLKTGIAKRDKDMQGPQYLETDKHPTAVLILNKLTTSKKALIEGEEVSDRFGSLPIHINASNLTELIKPQGGKSVREVIERNLRAIEAQEKKLGRIPW